jgi:hypothetical protein
MFVSGFCRVARFATMCLALPRCAIRDKDDVAEAIDKVFSISIFDVVYVSIFL